MIAKQRAGGDGRHTSVQTVEAERTVHKIGWAFARTADAAEFDHILRHNAQFIHRADDLVRDRVMSAALAQCARVSAVIIFCKAGKIYIRGCASHGKWLSHDITPFALLLRSGA